MKLFVPKIRQLYLQYLTRPDACSTVPSTKLIYKLHYPISRDFVLSNNPQGGLFEGGYFLKAFLRGEGGYLRGLMEGVS